MSPVNMTPSAYKHGFSIEEAMYVILNPVNSQHLDFTHRGEKRVYVGYPYAGSDRPVELIAELIPPRTIEVFHFSDLTDIYRPIWKENQ